MTVRRTHNIFHINILLYYTYAYGVYVQTRAAFLLPSVVRLDVIYELAVVRKHSTRAVPFKRTVACLTTGPHSNNNNSNNIVYIYVPIVHIVFVTVLIIIIVYFLVSFT